MWGLWRHVGALAAALAVGGAPPAALGHSSSASVSFGGLELAYSPATVRVQPSAGVVPTVTWVPRPGAGFNPQAAGGHPLVFADGAPGSQPGDATFTRAFPTTGRYFFQCRLHGDAGMRGVVEVTANDAPVASFVSLASVDEGTALAFDAGASYDANADAASAKFSGQKLVYAWDFDGDGNDDAVGSTPRASHTYPVAGSYTVRLRVTDDNADAIGPETSEATRVVVVRPRAPVGSGGDRGATDNRAPTVTLHLAPRQRLRGVLRRGLAVRARSSEPALASATLRRGRRVLGRGSLGFVAAGTRTLTIRPNAAGRALLRRARRVTLQLSVVVTDAGGNARRLSRRVVLRR